MSTNENPTAKKPAHEVILNKFEERLNTLVRHNEDSTGGYTFALLEILSEMVIPEKHRKETIEKLEALGTRCRVWEMENRDDDTTNIGATLREALRVLKEEKPETEEKAPTAT